MDMCVARERVHADVDQGVVQYSLMYTYMGRSTRASPTHLYDAASALHGLQRIRDVESSSNYNFCIRHRYDFHAVTTSCPPKPKGEVFMGNMWRPLATPLDKQFVSKELREFPPQQQQKKNTHNKNNI